jgi:hypothetical protein
MLQEALNELRARDATFKDLQEKIRVQEEQLRQQHILLRNQQDLIDGFDKDHPVVIASSAFASSASPYRSGDQLQVSHSPRARVTWVQHSDTADHAPETSSSSKPVSLQDSQHCQRDTQHQPGNNKPSARPQSQTQEAVAARAPAVQLRSAWDALKQPTRRPVQRASAIPQTQPTRKQVKGPSTNDQANAADQAMILELQRRIQLRNAQAPFAPAKMSARQQELKIARITGDRELLTHGSDKVTEADEVLSEDDRHDVLAEAGPANAARLLFNPRYNLRNKHGYVSNAFIASESEPSTHGTDDCQDDDPSSDYNPSTSNSPSPAKQSERRSLFENEPDYQEFLAFKAAKRASMGTDHVDATAFTATSRSRHPSPTPSDFTPRYQLSFAEPPDHGEWDDVHHLVTTFRDKHKKYAQRMGEGRHLSVWECYNDTAKTKIIKFLEDPRSASNPYTHDYMANLSDDQLYHFLQEKLGITYPLHVEAALKAIKFTGPPLEKQTWVNLHTAWSHVLRRVTASGQLAPRRMSDLFRDCITDQFIKQYLQSRKDPTWEDAYTAVITGLMDPMWITCYCKDQAQRLTDLELAAKKQHTDKGAAPAAPKLKQSLLPFKTAKDFDPLTYTNSRRQVNVNPNLKPDVNHNPNREPCNRCSDVHRYKSEYCTAPFSKDRKKLDALEPAEIMRRLTQRWNDGFFFLKPLEAHAPKSPSVATSAKLSQDAAQRLAQ